MTLSQDKIRKVLERGPAQAGEIKRQTDLSESALYVNLRKMMEAGVVQAWDTKHNRTSYALATWRATLVPGTVDALIINWSRTNAQTGATALR